MPDRHDEYLLLNGVARETRATLDGFGYGYSFPSGRRQKGRLDDKFGDLRAKFNLSSRGSRLTTGPEGYLPDQVIVLEIVGDIGDFVNAAKRIEGLDFQFEVGLDEMPANEDFFDPEKEGTEHELSTKMYLILSNQDALRKILVLWNKWKKAPNKSFAHGWNKWKDLFKCLKDVRTWSDIDRLHETGVIQYWQEQVNSDKKLIYSEIELWFITDEVKRLATQNAIAESITQIGGQVVQQTIIPEIRYHGLIANIPREQIANFINGNMGSLQETPGVMFFRPCAQAVVSANEEATEITDAVVAVVAPKPEKCLILDGFPLANHGYLQNRVNVNDLFDFANTCPPADRKHGTAVSSLVVHGEVLPNPNPVPFKIVVTPILKPEVVNISGGKAELVPENLNVVDLVHQAVLHNMKQYPTIKLINFSIGIHGRPYTQMISPLARLIDWLSWKYQVTFIISAGNCPDDIQIDATQWTTFSPVQKRNHVMGSVFQDIRNRKILSPAESFSGLTVGAAHADTQTFTLPATLVDPAEHGHISPISRFGPGIRRSLKPELYFSGGRQLLHNPFPGQSSLRVTNYNATPGIITAAPANMGRTGTAFQRGTSFSAALATHFGLRILDFLDGQRTAGKVIPAEFEHLLVKALLVNSGESVDFLEKTKALLQGMDLTPHELSEMGFAISGYGIAQPDKALGSTDYRATAIAFGKLKQENSMEFTFPIPDNLGGRRGLRRLSTTLTWSSSFNPSSMKYNSSAFFTEVSASGLNKIGCKRVGIHANPTRRGSIEHLVYSGEAATAFSQNSNITLTVNSRKYALKDVSETPFALVVTMETAEQTGIQIFNQIKTRIQAQAQTQARART